MLWIILCITFSGSPLPVTFKHYLHCFYTLHDSVKVRQNLLFITTLKLKIRLNYDSLRIKKKMLIKHSSRKKRLLKNA